MAEKTKGIVSQFGTKGYGFINGDEGRKYFIHQKNTYNKLPLQIDTRVVFDVERSEKGLVAMRVQLEAVAYKSKSLSDRAIKVLFAILFIIQIIVIYRLFFLA